MTSATDLTQSAAESALQPLLDGYAKQKRTAAQLTAELVSICTQQPAATWQALSLLDRYHRREELSTALFRDLKKELNAIAFGSGRSALSAPGPETDRTSGFMSLFGTKRGNRTATFARNRTGVRTSAGHTAQLDANPRTVGIGTAHLQNDAQNTAHLQARGGKADQVDTVYLDDDEHSTAHLRARGDEVDRVDTIYLQDDEQNTSHLQASQDNTAHLQAPSDRTERLRSTHATAAPASPPSENAALAPAPIPENRTSRLQERAAYLEPQRDSTVRLRAAESVASQGPEPRTNWLDGQRPDPLQEQATDYFSSTELRQSHAMARPTGTIVQEPLREATLPRSLRTRSAYVDPAPRTQAEVEHATLEREALTQATLEKSPSLRPGVTLIDRYVLVEPISTGGVGVVFKAFDRLRESLPESQRYVAIKCLHEGLQNDARAIAALHHEYRQSQALSHPNILKMLDFHQADGVSFLTLELIDGESLAHICERITPRRLPPSRALTIVREIGHAIAHAHENGILHGNLHPNNVVITRSGLVKVGEFGQATAWLDSAALPDLAMRDMPPSQPERRYKSPQQKNAVPVDAADDIYSLACIAFELLCGRAPDATVHKVGARKPAYADHVNPKRWQALQRGLADDRAQRGNDVRQWLAELDLSSAAIRLPSISDLETELFGGESNRSLFAALWVVGGLVTTTAAVALGAWLLWPKEDASSIAQPDRTVAAKPKVIDTPVQTAPQLDAAPTPTGQTVAPDTTTSIDERVTSRPTEPADANVSPSGMPTVGFTQSQYDISVDASVAVLTIQRRGPTTDRLVLQWFTIEGSAKSDVDYVRDGNTTVVLSPGQRTATVTIPLIRGAARDRTVWFDVRIRATTQALPGETVVATINLLPTSANSISP